MDAEGRLRDERTMIASVGGFHPRDVPLSRWLLMGDPRMISTTIRYPSDPAAWAHEGVDLNRPTDPPR